MIARGTNDMPEGGDVVDQELEPSFWQKIKMGAGDMRNRAANPGAFKGQPQGLPGSFGEGLGRLISGATMTPKRPSIQGQTPSGSSGQFAGIKKLLGL